MSSEITTTSVATGTDEGRRERKKRATRHELIAHAARLSCAIRDRGGEADIRLWPGLWRVFEYYDIPEAETSLDDIAAFLMPRIAR